jgi:hypothetical protein
MNVTISYADSHAARRKTIRQCQAQKTFAMLIEFVVVNALGIGSITEGLKEVREVEPVPASVVTCSSP